MNMGNATLWLLGGLLLMFSLPLVVVYVQGHRHRTQAKRGLEEIWRDSRLDVSKSEFELYQILPGDSSHQATLMIRDETGMMHAEIVFHSRDRADIKVGERLLSAFDQAGIIGHSSYAGLVGGSTDRSIVIRDGERVLVELIADSDTLPSRRRFTWKGETYTVDERVASVRDQIFMVRDSAGQVVGQFASQDWAGLSGARYVAVRRSFDPMVALWLCYLATLTSCKP